MYYHNREEDGKAKMVVLNGIRNKIVSRERLEDKYILFGASIATDKKNIDHLFGCFRIIL
jgi:hypothetical protein